MKLPTCLRRLLPAALLAALPALAADAPPPTAPQKDAAWTAPEARAAVFDQVMRELDENGDLLLFWNTQDLMRDMMRSLRQTLSSLPAMDADTKARAEGVAQKVETFLDKNGFYSVRGLGFSSIPDGKGAFVHKAFLARDPAAANAPMWRVLGGEPRMMKSLAFQPKDAAIFFAANADPKALWTLVRDGVRQIGGEEALKEVDANLAPMKQETGFGLDELLSCLGDELFVSLRLEEGCQVSIPIPGETATIPAPAIIVGVALRDPQAAEVCLKSFIEATHAPLAPVEGRSPAVYVMAAPEPQPGQPEFKPAVTIQQGFLLVASNPAALQAALDASRNGGGLAATADYKAAFAGLPEKVNGIGYVSPLFVRTLDGVLAAAAKAAETRGPDRMAAVGFSVIRSLVDIRPINGVRVNKPEGIQVIVRGACSGRMALAKLAALPLFAVANAALVTRAQQFQHPGSQAGMNTRRRLSGDKETCRANLKQIDIAVQAWCADNESDTIPTWNQLIIPGNPTNSYLKAMPKCPKGGTYTLPKDLTDISRCSVHGSRGDIENGAEAP